MAPVSEGAGYRSEQMTTLGARDTLVHLRARDYDPSTGTFTSTDPLDAPPGSPTLGNPYAYVHNEPIDSIDPTGMQCNDRFCFTNPFCVAAGGSDCTVDIGQEVANAAAGVLNAATMGHAQTVLSWAGAADRYDPNSLAFHIGEWAGAVALVVIPALGSESLLFGANGARVEVLTGGMFEDSIIAESRAAAEVEGFSAARDAELAATAADAVETTEAVGAAEGEVAAEAEQIAARATTDAHGATAPSLAEEGATKAGGESIDLYHGASQSRAASIAENGPDLSMSRSNLDFGRGFYTGTDQAQAARLATARFGDEATVMHFQVPAADLEGLNGLNFSGPSSSWEEFVTASRGGAGHGYDVVSGPILANPGALAEGGGLRPLTSDGGMPTQVSFHTPDAIRVLMGGLR